MECNEDFTFIKLMTAISENPANIYLLKINNRNTRKRC